MTRRRASCLALTAGILFASLGIPLSTGAGAATATSDGFTPLPASWETCVLQQIGAKVNPTDVADLDEWQLAEGGSTDNDYAYNPFNTKRAIDGNGTAIPGVVILDGFPAFASWETGCTATVATILQPNMAPIVSALTSTDPPPPSEFLAVVDLTPWCAPSGGMPCYEWFIAAGGSPPPSQAVALVADSMQTLGTYAKDHAALAGLQGTLAAYSAQLRQANIQLSMARLGVQRALDQLRALAVTEYTSNSSLDRVANLDQFDSPTSTQQLEQYYQGVDANQQVGRYQQAQAALAAAAAQQASSNDQVSRATVALASAHSDADKVLAHLALDLSALQAAGACGNVPPLTTAPDQAYSALVTCAGSLAG